MLLTVRRYHYLEPSFRGLGSFFSLLLTTSWEGKVNIIVLCAQRFYSPTMVLFSTAGSLAGLCGTVALQSYTGATSACQVVGVAAARPSAQPCQVHSVGF